MISIGGLSYRYPGTDAWALEDIGLEIPAGQFCGVVGANGAGKSTLCYALSGFVPHFYRGKYQGQVRVGDVLVADTAQGDLAGQVGLVFQNPFNQMSGARFTVREEIAYGLENLGLPRDEIQQRLSVIIEETDLNELAERSPFALSGGQQQRVAIASIMAMRPRVLVLDEPTSQLDPRGTEEVFANLNTLAEERGITVVLAEHKLEWLAAHCDRVLALHEGRLVADGAPEEVLASEALHDYGIGATQYTHAARQAQQGGLVPSRRQLPVTLKQAGAFFQ